MELKLNIYEDKLCRKYKRTVAAKDFELSTAICEDVLDIINIDMFAGGLEALSNDELIDLAVPIIKNGFPYFVTLIADIFEITEGEAKHTKIREIGEVLVNIVKYSIGELKSSVGTKSKN